MLRETSPTCGSPSLMQIKVDGRIETHSELGSCDRVQRSRPNSASSCCDATLYELSAEQMAAWTEFANVLRANAKRSAEARGAQGQQSVGPGADRLDQQERWLATRLEGVRALKATYGKLYAVLDDKQKKMVDELM